MLLLLWGCLHASRREGSGNGGRGDYCQYSILVTTQKGGGGTGR